MKNNQPVKTLPMLPSTPAQTAAGMFGPCLAGFLIGAVHPRSAVVPDPTFAPSSPRIPSFAIDSWVPGILTSCFPTRRRS